MTGNPVISALRSDGLRQTGFSLLEVLVVMVILGLTATFVTVGFERLENDRLERSAGRLAEWFQALSDEAVLNGAVYGARFDTSGEFQPLFYFRNRWWPLSDQVVGQPPAIDVSLRLEVHHRDRWVATGIERDDELPRPDVVFFPQGMVQPDQWRLTEDKGAGASALVERNDDGLFLWQIL